MECTEPGAIHDEELLAYLAGEKVRPLVVQHLAKCQHCSSKLMDYRYIELMLTSKLYRWDCPTNQILGEYQLGLLSNEHALAVKVHLSNCVLCVAEVTTLEAFLTNDPLLVGHSPAQQVTVFASRQNHRRFAHEAERVLEHLRDRSRAGIRRIIATLLPTPPRFSYQRGISAVWPRLYTAEDVSISIQVERGIGRTDSLQLIGFVTRKGAALEEMQGTPVLLSSQASTAYTQNVDELGNFIFSSISPATYMLELQFPESVIVIDQLAVSPLN